MGLDKKAIAETNKLTIWKNLKADYFSGSSFLYDFSLLTAKRVSQQRNEPQETINHLLCGWCNKCL